VTDSVLRSLLREPPASRRLARRAVVAGIAVPLVAAVSGCGIGKSNETQHERASVQAASIVDGPIHINDIYVTPVGETVSPDPGVSLASADASVVPSIAPTPTLPPKGQVDGYLVATVTDTANVRTDALTGVTIGAGTAGSQTSASTAVTGTVGISPANAKVSLAPNSQLHFLDPADTAAGSNGPYLVITRLTRPLVIGETLPVSFTLQNAGPTATVQVPVISSYYGTPPTVPPGASSAPATSATPGAGSGKKTGASPSAAPTTSQSASP
jgi:hypothetical protein